LTDSPESVKMDSTESDGGGLDEDK
jgi:hypothetical protein